MRKFLMLLLLAMPLSAQQAQTKWVHNRDDYSDSISVVVIKGREYVGEFKAPAIYDKWWAEIMTCSKLHAPKKDRDSMRWYWVYGDEGFLVEGGAPLFIGWSSIWTRQIYLTQSQLLNSTLVKHEMLHFLLWETATPIGFDGHPKLFFRDRCKLI